MKNIFFALTIIAFQFGFAQKPAKKAITKENPVLYKENQILKAISGAVKQLQPDTKAKVLSAPLKQIASDCIDIMYYQNDTADSAFFELLKQNVSYKWSFTNYAVTLNGQTHTVPMKLLLVKFTNSTDMPKTSGILAPCYCLPNAYVIALYSNDGWFLSFEPDFSQVTEPGKRSQLYNSLQKYLRQSLTGFTHQNVSLWNND